MGDAKKIVIVIVCLVVIGAVIAFIVRSSSSPESIAQEEPEALQGLKYSRIDLVTNETITLTRAEWNKLGHNKNHVWKNPKTGEYTMVDIATCVQCGKPVPSMVLDWETVMEGSRETQEERRAEFHRAWEESECPHCGASPCFPPPPF